MITLVVVNLPLGYRKDDADTSPNNVHTTGT